MTSGLIELWSAGFYIYGLSVFFKPISSDLGLSRAATSAVSSAGRFEGGFASPVAGWGCDRYGPRRVVLFGLALASMGLLLMYYVNSLVAFISVWAVLQGTGRNFTSGVPNDTAISNWFIKKRGVALSIK